MWPSAFAKIVRKIRARLPKPEFPTHPIDAQYGIETSSRVKAAQMSTGDDLVDRENIGYVGSQPSLIRRALARIDDLSQATFIDLGCGKGRALAVASEYPFRRVVGIEASEPICVQARANAAVIARKFPERTAIDIVHGNAAAPALPEAGLAILFLYNSFGLELIDQLVAHLARAIAARPELKLFVIYYNPVYFASFDDSGAFARHSAEKNRFSPEETGSSPFGNDFDSVVIYQSLGATMQPQHDGADREIRITVPRYGADVAMEPI